MTSAASNCLTVLNSRAFLSDELVLLMNEDIHSPSLSHGYISLYYIQQPGAFLVDETSRIQAPGQSTGLPPSPS